MSVEAITPSVAERLIKLAQKLLPFANEEEKAVIDEHLAEIAPAADEIPTEAKPAPTEPLAWLRTMFPAYFPIEFAEHHKAFWRKVWAVERNEKPEADIEVWPRGGGKTTHAETAVVMAGVRGRRKYILYVRRTQKRADDAVGNIAKMLGSTAIAEHYPLHAQRYVGAFGKQGEWRRERIRTNGGLIIDALGLDTATRGVKIDEERPDMIIFDDIDEPLDGPNMTEKKATIMKSSVIPAGSSTCWFLGVQNLITKHGVFSQLVTGQADFLSDAVVSGPIPAIRNLVWEWGKHPKTGRRCGIIKSGTPTWEGQNLAICQRMIYDSSISTFLKECNHDVFKRGAGTALRYDETRHTAELTDDEISALVGMGRVFGGVDFGFWRFGFTLWAVDRKATIYRVDEMFAQNLDGQKSLSERAKGMHYLCEDYGLDPEHKAFPIWGDSASPTDIHEMNQIFRKGWHDEETHRKITSKLRIVGVERENKLRKASVDKLNDLLDENRLLFIPLESYEWRHAMTVDNPEGTPMEGSRLLWEIGAWSFDVPKPGEPQTQDPNDDTADGADMVASMRYGVMSYWSAAKNLMDFGKVENLEDRAEHFDVAKRRFIEAPHAVDVLTEPRGRRAAAVRAPRLRIGKR